MQTETEFKSEVVRFACRTYVYLVGVGKAKEPATLILAKCLENVNPIGPETLREVASNAADGVYAAELDALVTELQK